MATDDPKPLPQAAGVSLGTLQSTNATGLVAGACEIAKVLASVIKDQKLSNNIHGREYVRVEGWTTLAALLGFLPVEVMNHADKDGTYTATVELRRMADGSVISSATSECGMDEPTWAARMRYARRSMAATRATGKVCRLSFSWIMALAGYEVTPLEEMPENGSQRIDTHGDYDPRPKRDELVLRFGSLKGKHISDVYDDPECRADLQWYVQAIRESIDNPAKANWKDANQRHLDALLAWKAERTQARMDAAQPPPDEDETLPFEAE